MRQRLIAIALTLLAACGSSSEPPPLYGGFTPVDATAIVFPPTTCDIPFLGLTSISGLAILETDFARACDYVTASQLCDAKASATLVLSVGVSGALGGATAPVIGPGTYPYLANPPTTSPFAAALGQAVRTDAACVAVPGTATDMNGGSVVVTSITATRAAGSLNLRFDNGTSFVRPFDVELCAPPADICQLIVGGGCGAPACLP